MIPEKKMAAEKRWSPLPENTGVRIDGSYLVFSYDGADIARVEVTDPHNAMHQLSMWFGLMFPVFNSE